jgi:polyisoprenoid-binding protein YceI
MKTSLAIGILALSLFLSACEDPAANKTKAITSNASAPANAVPANAAATAPSAKGEQLAIDPENSKVSFVGSKVTGSHDGGFTKFSGLINLVNGKVEDSSVNVDIETASIFANVDQLTTHLKSADFFDVEKYPKATFTSTKFVPNAEKGADNYTVTGDLDLHGQKKSITFPATIKVAADSVDVNAEFSINRKDFGILYAGKADDLIRDDVVIKLELKSPRKK